MAEVHIGLGVDRNKVDMGVGHFQTYDGHADALAGDCLADGFANRVRAW